MAEPVTMENLVQIFQEMNSNIAKSMSDLKLDLKSDITSVKEDAKDSFLNNQAKTDASIQDLQTSVQAQILSVTSKIESNVFSLMDSTAENIAVLSNRLEAVKFGRNSRASSRVGTPAKVAQPFPVFEPTVITENQTEIVFPNVTTSTSREAKSVSSSSVASQSGAQTSVRTEQKQSAKPASNLPMFVEPKSLADVVLKRLRILQRIAAQPIAQLYAKCLAENEVKFAQ